MDILDHIKRLLLRDQVVFTIKAQDEMYRDALTDDDVIEAIINAPVIYKTLRSTSRKKRGKRETLYVIVGETYDGILIYTKGTIRRQQGADVFYVMISAKRNLRS